MLEEGIAETPPGPKRKALKDRRHAARVALGVAAPKEEVQPAPVQKPAPSRPPPTPEEGKKLAAAMRQAVAAEVTP